MRTRYTAEEIDGFAICVADMRETYWLPRDQFGGLSYVHLRLAPARNNQQIGLHFAAEYQLGAVAQLGERVAGSHEVRGSSPLSSTTNVTPLF